MMRASGGVLLASAIVGIVLAAIGVTFGLAPLMALVLLLVPVALLGGWLRRTGALRLRRLGAAAARRGQSLEAT